MRRIFVSLGTIHPYRFDALIDALIPLLNDDDVVTWQVGSTTRSDLPGTMLREMPAAAFDELVRDSDLVISHAGVGSAIRCLELGVKPVLVPRSKARKEHVDDHQHQIANLLSDAGLAVVCSPADLSTQVLAAAAGGRVARGQSFDHG